MILTNQELTEIENEIEQLKNESDDWAMDRLKQLIAKLETSYYLLRRRKFTVIK